MSLQTELIRIAREECKANNVKLYLGRGKSINYSFVSPRIRVNGFFDFDVKPPKQMKLACATGRKNWELILVHELSHMHQWMEDCKVWKDYCATNGDMIDRAISGKSTDNTKLEHDAMVTLLLEHDCEKRAHELLKNLGYPKNKLDEYVQKANSYALFYLYILHNKKWYKVGKEPYNLKNVWKHFPKTFNIDIEATFHRLKHHFDQCVN